MQNQNRNSVDDFFYQLFHSKAFKIWAIIVACLVGIPFLILFCLLFILFISILIPGLGVLAAIVGSIIAWIFAMLSIPYPPP